MMDDYSRCCRVGGKGGRGQWQKLFVGQSSRHELFQPRAQRRKNLVGGGCVSSPRAFTRMNATVLTTARREVLGKIKATVVTE